MNRRSLLLSSAAAAVGCRIRWTSAQDGNSLVWSEVPSTDPRPPARYDHSLSASDPRRLLLLFGGRDSAGTALGDTWIFSRGSGTWQDLAGLGPSPRFGHAVASDQDAGITYLFGGQAGEIFHNDLWTFDSAEARWTLVHDGTGDAPPHRYGTSLVRTDTGQLILSHGFTFSGRFDDTWMWDADDGWTEITPYDGDRPLNRCLHEAVWDAGAGAMLLFGGCSSGYGPCPQGDLWSFNPASRSWALLDPQPAPTGRMNPALVYDRGRERILLIGGLTESGYDAGAWTLADSAATSWARLDAPQGPSPRASHDACVTGPHLYLFGGISDAGLMGDFWTARLDRN